jgi:hypothetical protein
MDLLQMSDKRVIGIVYKDIANKEYYCKLKGKKDSRGFD